MNELCDKVEIVGIACNDRESILRETIEKNGIKWKNYMEEDDLSFKYGITGYPTKILIDPDGKILLRYDGEGPTFYKEVQKYLK